MRRVLELRSGVHEAKTVGLTGFEPATPTPPVWCATKLRHSPFLAYVAYTARGDEYTLQHCYRALRNRGRGMSRVSARVWSRSESF